eukprot:scaffold28590_cov62-Phaeocystis_antarctica.AAC.2
MSRIASRPIGEGGGDAALVEERDSLLGGSAERLRGRLACSALAGRANVPFASTEGASVSTEGAIVSRKTPTLSTATTPRVMLLRSASQASRRDSTPADLEIGRTCTSNVSEPACVAALAEPISRGTETSIGPRLHHGTRATELGGQSRN